MARVYGLQADSARIGDTAVDIKIASTSDITALHPYGVPRRDIAEQGAIGRTSYDEGDRPGHRYI